MDWPDATGATSLACGRDGALNGGSRLKRNFGLDIYRSVAILMVLCAHGLALMFGAWFNTTPLLYTLGLGVEIFFALSGFLIGGILIRDVVEQPRTVSAPRKLLSFYLRRWLRTLPLYYLMVIVSVYYAEWPHFSLGFPSLGNGMLLANLFFLQNFQNGWLALQPVSWSLAIEEWFYLLIPLGMVAISFVRRRRLRARLVLAYGVAVVLAVLAYRASDVLVNHSSWDYGTRKQIFMHMDALMFGVLAAWLSHYHAALYQRVARNRWFGVAALVVVVFISYRYVYRLIDNNSIDRSFMAHTLSLSIMGAGFAALVIAFQAQFADISRIPGWLVAVFEHISTRSYGYYLIHFPVFVLMARALTPGSLIQNCVVALGALALTFLIAGAIHIGYEQPFMRLRDRIRLVPKAPALRGAISPAEEWEAARMPETALVRRLR